MYPHLIYGKIWGGTYSSHLISLDVIQKKFIRAITNSQYNAHTIELFKSTGLLKIQDIHKFLISQHMFHTLLDSPPQAIHNHFTRYSSDPQPTFQRLS